jgi:RNA polymerase sigma factor (sigma-70 family)
MEYSEELYKQSMGIIRALAYKLIKKEDESIIEFQDLVEVGKETFLKCLKTYKEDKGAKFSTYLHIKARSAMRDEIRRNSFTRRAKPGVAAMVLFSDRSRQDDMLESSNPEEVILIREQLEFLRKRLRELPKEYRTILKLIYWNGMNMLEVSAFLNLSEGRVSQLHKEAIDYLRELNER